MRMASWIGALVHANPISLFVSFNGVIIYLGFSLLNMVAMARAKQIPLRSLEALHIFVPIKDLLSASGRIDLVLSLLNRSLNILASAYAIFLAIHFSPLFTSVLVVVAGPVRNMAPDSVAWLLALLVAFIPRDFLQSYVHWLQHKVPILWEIHKVHHSAQSLSPMTGNRSHPLQVLADATIQFVGLALSIGLIRYFYNFSDVEIALIAVNSWMIAHIVVLTPLHHSHVALRFGILEKILLRGRFEKGLSG